MTLYEVVFPFPTSRTKGTSVYFAGLTEARKGAAAIAREEAPHIPGAVDDDGMVDVRIYEVEADITKASVAAYINFDDAPDRTRIIEKVGIPTTAEASSV